MCPTRKSSSFFLENLKSQNCVCIGQQTLYITSSSECHRITSPAPRSVQSVVQLDLECTHEEADTRILLNVKHALCPPLTLMPLPWLCMLFMLFTYRVGEDKAWLQCYIHIKLSGSRTMSYLFSGCDSISQFLGYGKKTAMQCFR